MASKTFREILDEKYIEAGLKEKPRESLSDIFRVSTEEIRAERREQLKKENPSLGRILFGLFMFVVGSISLIYLIGEIYKGIFGG